MRVVLDTNILVRATKNAAGPARQLLEIIDSDEHVLILSEYILTELLRVLAYPRLKAMHGLCDEECVEFAQSLHDACEVIAIGHDPSAAISADPDDDPVIETAVRGNAEVLCTLDRHLRHQDVRNYCQGHGIEVMTDVELLEFLKESESLDDAVE